MKIAEVFGEGVEDRRQDRRRWRGWGGTWKRYDIWRRLGRSPCQVEESHKTVSTYITQVIEAAHNPTRPLIP
jgi:hypothetical protein